MLSPSYFLISILGKQKETLEQGSTATFQKKAYRFFVVVDFFFQHLHEQQVWVGGHLLFSPQAILGAVF